MSTATVGRERVLREARALFIERGFAEVSMQQIADAVGVTKAALYYHFRNKEDLFAHVAQHEQEHIVAGLTKELEAGTTFRERLERAARFVFSALESDFARLETDVERHVSEPYRQRLNLRTSPIDFLRPYFERAATTGELRETDVEFAIQLFLSMILGLKQMAVHPEAAALGGIESSAVVDVFLNGIAARP